MRVINGLRLSILYILLINGWNLVKCNENKKENAEEENKKRKAIELDINSRKSTKEYYYHEDYERKFGFYVSSGDFVFQGAKRSGSFLSGVWFSQNIWTSKDVEEDAGVVIVNGVGKGVATVTILHKSGKAREFHKSGIFKKWEEKKMNFVQNENDKFKIIALEDDESEKKDENKQFLLKNSNGDPYLNVIKDGVRCIEIKYNDVTAWKYDEQGCQEYPRALYYMNNKFILFFDDFFQVYNYIGDSCELLYTNKIEPSMVSMDDRESSKHYDYYNDGSGTVSYTAKEGYAFDEVKFLRSWVHSIRLDRNVWKAPNISQYANKVIMKNNGLFKKSLNVYLISGEMIVYYRSSWGLRWNRKGCSKFIVRSLTQLKDLPPGLKVITRLGGDSNPKTFKENDATKFKLYKYHSDERTEFIKFEFENGAQCVAIKYNDSSVWNFGEGSGARYPKSITYMCRRFRRIFKIEFSDDLQYIYRCNGRIMDLILSRLL